MWKIFNSHAAAEDGDTFTRMHVRTLRVGIKKHFTNGAILKSSILFVWL